MMGTFVGTGPDRQWTSEVPGSQPIPAPESDGHAALRHALAVATHTAEQIGDDGFPIMGTVERGAFLIEAVRAFLKNS